MKTIFSIFNENQKNNTKVIYKVNINRYINFINHQNKQNNFNK